MSIVLSTLNARYSHTSLALRYLFANMNELKGSTNIMEFTINENIQDIAEKLLLNDPYIIGIGVYIWNSTEISRLIKILKKISPDTILVLGGPEVSHQPYRVDFSLADYIVKGEGDISFYKLCKGLTDGIKPINKIIECITPDINDIALPYKYYSDHDIKNRVTYVEASRGCPFTCEFCLSSIDPRVRNFDVDSFITELQELWDRGARNYKFIDRTFNINIDKVNRILDFFLSRDGAYMVHFEVIPEYFPARLKDKLKMFKPGYLQLEVGIQTLNPDVANRINRKMDFSKIKENLSFLQEETNAHLHVDLIIGLPGESIQSFAKNLNLLTSITDCEIQLGILKKLSGTTLSRHDKEYSMIFSDEPPYTLLQNSEISFQKMQELKRVARYWDICFNSGNFKGVIKLLWQDGDVYTGFSDFSSWLFKRSETTYQISLNRISEYLFEYLTDIKELSDNEVGDLMARDLLKLSGRKLPGFLKKYNREKTSRAEIPGKVIGKRQSKHLD